MENEFKGDFRIKECYYSEPLLKIVDENKKVFAIVPMRDSYMHRWGYEMQNARLISKALELLERIKEQNIDLKILKSNLIKISESNKSVVGYSETVQKWIDENENLIKEATTI